MDSSKNAECVDILPEALVSATSWARARSRERWEDVVQDGLVRFLAMPVNQRPTTVSGQRLVLRRGMIDGLRRWQGDLRRPQGKFWQRVVSWDVLASPPPAPEGDEYPLPLMQRDVARLLRPLLPRDQAILWAWATGEAPKDIATRLGLTRGRISQILTQHAPGWRALHRVER